MYNKLIINVVINLTYDASLTTSDMYSFWTIALVWCNPEVIAPRLRRSRSDRKAIASDKIKKFEKIKRNYSATLFLFKNGDSSFSYLLERVLRLNL